ncbi:MAG TPA: YeeE/YedE thiosulfate transporter family protein [Longimicrobiales bacterium]|nr:YeeE/YedE thiosulfate transporter family protein [Longimicrobiales bacterium]
MSTTLRKARAAAPSHAPIAWGELCAYLITGTVFGTFLTKGEAISWFRMQEMFRFHSFYMFGVLGTAVATAAASIALIKRFRLRAWTGQLIVIEPKVLGTGTRYWAGGTIFGFGWAFTGACPGPLFALVSAGLPVMLVALLSAVAGTWVYGWLRPKLPH